MYGDYKGYKSLQLSPWPEFTQALADDQVEEHGDLIIAVIGEVRREKAEKRLPLNTQIKKLTVYAGDQKAAEIIKEGKVDIAGTCKVTRLEVLAEKGSGRTLSEYPEVTFTAEYEE